MSQILQGITFGFFEDLPDSDRSHLDDILHGDKSQTARPDLPWDEDTDDLSCTDPAVTGDPTDEVNLVDGTASGCEPSNTPADTTAVGGQDFPAHPPPGVHPPIYLPRMAAIPGVQPVYTYVGVYPQQGMPSVPISYVPVMPPPSEAMLQQNPSAPITLTSCAPPDTPSEIIPDNYYADNNNTCTQHEVDKQANKILGGKTYERRNKKRRPPDYYQRLESTKGGTETGEQVSTVSAHNQSVNACGQLGPLQPMVALPGQHVQYHSSVLPPAGIHPMHAPYIHQQSSPSHIIQASSSPTSPPLANHIVVPANIPHYPPGLGAVPISTHFIPPGAPVQGPPPPQRLSNSQMYHALPGSVPNTSNQMDSNTNRLESVVTVQMPNTNVCEQPHQINDRTAENYNTYDRNANEEDVTNISFGEVEEEFRNLAEEKNVFVGDYRSNNVKKSPSPVAKTVVGEEMAAYVDTDGANKQIVSQAVTDGANIGSKMDTREQSPASELVSNHMESDFQKISINDESSQALYNSHDISEQQPIDNEPALAMRHSGPPQAQPDGVGAAVSSSATQAVSAPAAAPAPVKPKATSWAGLFHGTSTAETATVIYHETAAAPVTDTVAPAKESETLPETVPVDDDEGAKVLGRLLKDYNLCYTAPSIQPRGLINRGNWCYVNATLQALLGCAPLYNLVKSLPGTYRSKNGPSSTPVLDSIVELANEFSPMPPTVKPIEKNTKGKGNVKHDITPGPVFEVQYIYKMLQVIKYDGFKSGRQEDAEEFLSCVLNGLHDEMTAAIKSLEGPVAKINSSEPEITANGEAEPLTEDFLMEGPVDDSGWEQVGPKNKVIFTRKADCETSPISQIFRGQFRNILSRLGAKESATLQPFFTLQLDIQSEKIFTVQDALENLVSRETLQGVTCAKTNVEVDASRRTMLEDLPPVLVLHLKCFVYDKNGGCQKVIKQVDFSNELEINKDLLSPTVRMKYTLQQRKYKLFAVVKHIGVRAIGGHYTADVYYQSLQEWLHFDDNQVNSVSMPAVFKFRSPRVPYLLYYRRTDQTS